MGSLVRKIKRNQLKKELGSNKIREIYHERFDTVEQKLRKEIKNGNNIQKN